MKEPGPPAKGQCTAYEGSYWCLLDRGHPGPHTALVDTRGALFEVTWRRVFTEPPPHRRRRRLT